VESSDQSMITSAGNSQGKIYYIQYIKLPPMSYIIIKKKIILSLYYPYIIPLIIQRI
jgi:hypothetical protein